MPSQPPLEAPVAARTLQAIVLIHEEVHTRESLAERLGVSRATAARIIDDARRIGADVTWSGAQHRYIVANAAEIMPAALYRLDLAYQPLA